VLNKIDSLWDALSSPAQVQLQIDRQRATTAEILGLPRDQVYPVSAQKGLVAKVTDDARLLQASCLPALENALATHIMGQRQKILGSAVAMGITDLQAEVGRVLNIRRRDLAEQIQELQGLRGKNASVIKHMRVRIANEQAEFDQAGAKIHAVRSVHLKLLRDVFGLLGSKAQRKEMTQLMQALQQTGIKLGIKKAYGETFDRLRESLRRVQSLTGEIQSMLAATFRQLNAEHGFSLQPPVEPQMERYLNNLDQVERGHLQYLGIGNAFRLAQPEFADRLVRALSTRLRSVHQAALDDVELWSKSAAAQLDAQLRERRRNFSRRIEAIDRIQQAAGGLDERIAEIEGLVKALDQLDGKLHELTTYLIRAQDVVVPVRRDTVTAELEPG
jgi:CRP-like cAMP-binding protein